MLTLVMNRVQFKRIMLPTLMQNDRILLFLNIQQSECECNNNIMHSLLYFNNTYPTIVFSQMNSTGDYRVSKTYGKLTFYICQIFSTGTHSENTIRLFFLCFGMDSELFSDCFCCIH